MDRKATEHVGSEAAGELKPTGIPHRHPPMNGAMRRRIGAKFRAHVARRREAGWTAEGIAAGCVFYFGGALAVGFLDSGWMLAGWLVVGLYLIARFAYRDEATAA